MEMILDNDAPKEVREMPQVDPMEAKDFS